MSMNDIFSMVILAIVQGIAEWVPISSSAHLMLVSKVLGYNNSLVFDIALHFGTLMAVFIYFGKDIVDIARDLLKLDFKSQNGRLGLMLIIATIPAAIAGYFLQSVVENTSGNLWFMSLGFGITSLILFIGSMTKDKKKELPGFKGAFLIGMAQILSLFRGISRSGSTISTGLLLGLDEKNAVKFSFLMSIPIVIGANLLVVGNNSIPSSYFGAAFISFLVGIATIHVSFKYILSNRKNLRWFALYTFLLALVIGFFAIF